MSVFALVAALASCQKVNLATELGGDLIPAVDNINTFDTFLTVQTYNYPFAATQDSSRSVSTDIHYVGSVSNDPLFGQTKATLFLQLLPTTLKKPFGFSSPNDIIALDSVVLVLSHRNYWGDTTQQQQVQVFELGRNTDFRSDSAYQINSNNFTYSNALSGVKTFLPLNLNDSLTLFREKAANQLRIRLDNSFGDRLLRFDSTTVYGTDSAFNANFKGFAVVPGTTGSGLAGFSLSDTNTKLAVYYRYTKSGAADTAVTYFRFGTNAANANYIQRNYGGSELAQVSGDQVADPLVYIQNAPGTYTRVVVPGLAGLANSVVHRAELQVEQVPDPLSGKYTSPTYLYLDAFDAAANVYRTIPFDVTIGSSNVLNFANFGSIGFAGTDPAGSTIRKWGFDLSRYVQHVVNKTLPAYEFRLYSPFITRTNYSNTTTVSSFQVNPTYAAGRVRVGGGNHPTQPMRLRVIYSRL
ncbi:hypothetical protein BUE76_12035 [Cnuella takakiae]|nr:hypothetical protein BUE76_12035 [Cnuella takakiae]